MYSALLFSGLHIDSEGYSPLNSKFFHIVWFHLFAGEYLVKQGAIFDLPHLSFTHILNTPHYREEVICRVIL
jgi:hypothetical protein